jgi:hypothetical protein
VQPLISRVCSVWPQHFARASIALQCKHQALFIRRDYTCCHNHVDVAIQYAVKPLLDISGVDSADGSPSVVHWRQMTPRRQDTFTSAHSATGAYRPVCQRTQAMQAEQLQLPASCCHRHHGRIANAHAPAGRKFAISPKGSVQHTCTGPTCTDDGTAVAQLGLLPMVVGEGPDLRPAPCSGQRTAVVARRMSAYLRATHSTHSNLRGDPYPQLTS